jgi:uncharacterized protein YggE
VSTRGVGRVTAVPDTLNLTMGVQTQDTSAKAALAANNDKTNALLKTLKSKGVAAKDLQTVDLSIQPNYAPNSMQITGYQVTNTVRATLHNLATAGGVVDAAANAVGDAVRLQQVGFSIGDDTAVRSAARSQAVHQAQAQAEQMAKAAGAKLDRIRTITEVPDNGPTPMYDVKVAEGGAAAPIQPGQVAVSVLVEITYDIS